MAYFLEMSSEPIAYLEQTCGEVLSDVHVETPAMRVTTDCLIILLSAKNNACCLLEITKIIHSLIKEFFLAYM